MRKRRKYPLTSLVNKKANKHFYKKCFFCEENDYNALNNHRIFPGKDGGTYHPQNVLVVCASCHSKIHSGRINVDRKYPQASNGLYKVHYWYDGQEFWRDESS